MAHNCDNFDFLLTVDVKTPIMETKRGDFVSIMKNKIICTSLDLLREEGLRFSVDTLAERLKISKKTIYKFFPNKEILALAIYEQYYADVIKQAEQLIGNSVEPVYSKMLYLYFDSKMMTRIDIFNKYKLNKTVFAYVTKLNDSLWSTISSAFEGVSSEKEKEAVRLIIDGSFEKLCNTRVCPDAVIERLVTLLC